MFSVKVVRGCV